MTHFPPQFAAGIISDGHGTPVLGVACVENRRRFTTSSKMVQTRDPLTTHFQHDGLHAPRFSLEPPFIFPPDRWCLST